ncbi:MAG: Mn-dependent transcriptional regulator MntR, partial [uncultured Solirubrobacteraceae bacterium]
AGIEGRQAVGAGGRGLREGHLRAGSRFGGRDGVDHRAGRPRRRDAGECFGDGETTGRARLGDERPIPRLPVDGGGQSGRAGDAPTSSAPRAVSGRGARNAVGPRARRGRGTRACALRRTRTVDRRQAGRASMGSPRRSHPHHHRRDHRSRHSGHRHYERRSLWAAIAHLRHGSGSSALPLRARNRARRSLRGRRATTLRRADFRALRGGRGVPGSRRSIGFRNARRSRSFSPTVL